MLSAGDPPAGRSPLFFGLRPRLLGALVLTAIVTLGVAALALLAPLQSQVRGDAVQLGQQTVTAGKTQLGFQPVGPDGLPSKARLQAAVDGLFHQHGDTYVVWTDHFVRWADTDRDSNRPGDFIAPAVVHQAMSAPRAHATPYTLRGNVFVVATRYRGQPSRPGRTGRFFVLEMIRHVDYVGTANSVVETSFLYAALAGLAVALLLGVALSSRLVRRLRLLRDAATRTVDESDLTTLVVPRDTVSDEIGELAQAFATMHARLRVQEDARRVFVATASHELRTPLASLDGMLELIAEDLAAEPVDLEDARARLARARVQSRRLGNLATDLLDLSRLDARLELRSEPVELGEAARAVAAEFDLRARGREVDVVLDEDARQSWAQADPGSVARIIRILLDNALQAAPPHSRIELRVRNGSGPPTVEVADSGPGVRADERELIFERFQRGSGHGPEGGFGLGLAIGSELATRMGGRLELTDAAPGATFRLTLPEASE